MNNDFIQELDVDYLRRALCTVPRKLSRTEKQLRAFIERGRAQRTYLVLTMPNMPQVQETVRHMTLSQMGRPHRGGPSEFLHRPLVYKRRVILLDWKGAP